MKTVLSIAGSDCSGGAGIQADIKTVTVHNMYAMSAITALTAQNTTGVYDIMDVSPEFVEQQLDCIFTDIFPDAVKIGMVSNPRIIKVIANKLNQYKPKNIVIDPVMIATSGGKLLKEEATHALIETLLPIADVITPNILEAEVLCGFPISKKEDMQKAAKVISSLISTNVLIKGGHLIENSDDFLYQIKERTRTVSLEQNTSINRGKQLASRGIWFEQERIINPNNHGTGCTLSSAIACNLADDKSLTESIRLAKNYITGALKGTLNLGKGSGPLNHCYVSNYLQNS